MSSIRMYANTFAPFFGTLDPDKVKYSFKKALKQVQQEKPAYKGKSGAQGWWFEVIRRTAIGAGAKTNDVDASLGDIVPRLMNRFSSKEGYTLFDDVVPVLRHLNESLKIRTALISNTDTRIRAVLQDLDVLHYLSPVLISEEAGVEKPERDLFCRACVDGIKPEECLHVGDELDCDYQGARNAGFHALLLRRVGSESDEAENPTGSVTIISTLWDIVPHLSGCNVKTPT